MPPIIVMVENNSKNANLLPTAICKSPKILQRFNGNNEYDVAMASLMGMPTNNVNAVAQYKPTTGPNNRLPHQPRNLLWQQR